jgi:CheY-like chemotaxis protein
VIQRLKAMSPTATLPVIAMSARDAATNRDRMLAAGAEAYIQKPADNQVLLQSIRDLLGDSEPERKAG